MVAGPSPINKEKLPPPGGTLDNPGIVASAPGVTTEKRVVADGQHPAIVEEFVFTPSVKVHPAVDPVSKSTFVHGAWTVGFSPL